MSLEYARTVGIQNAMLACYGDNEASKRVITNNGGIPDRTSEEGGKTVEIYYIKTAELTTNPKGACFMHP